MAKASRIAARQAQALQDVAENLAALLKQTAHIERKLNVIVKKIAEAEAKVEVESKEGAGT